MREQGTVQQSLIDEAAGLDFDLEGALSQIALVGDMQHGEPNDAVTHRHSSYISMDASHMIRQRSRALQVSENISVGSIAVDSDAGLVMGNYEAGVRVPEDARS